MEERIKEYLRKTDELLEAAAAGKASIDPEMPAEHLVQISFFQHERLIHLIVTALFAIIAILAMIMVLSVGGIVPFLLLILSLVLLVPYVRHYYILENGVQKMYRQYDMMRDILNRQ